MLLDRAARTGKFARLWRAGASRSEQGETAMTTDASMRELAPEEIAAVAGGCTEAPCPGSSGILQAAANVPSLANLIPPNPVVPPGIDGRTIPPNPVIFNLFG
jgi:hypothetical protein